MRSMPFWNCIWGPVWIDLTAPTKDLFWSFRCWSHPSTCQVVVKHPPNPQSKASSNPSTLQQHSTQKAKSRSIKTSPAIQPLLPTNHQRPWNPKEPAGPVPRFIVSISMAPVGGNHPQVMHLRWFRAQKSAIKLQRSGDILLEAPMDFHPMALSMWYGDHSQRQWKITVF